MGALAAGLRMIRDDGGAIRFRHALLRWIAYWFVGFSVWTGFCAGLVCATINPPGKRLGALMAGTIVIRTRAPQPPPPVPQTPPELAIWTSQLELSRLPDDLVTASRHFVQRRAGLLSFPRHQLGGDLARQVAARTAPPAPVPLEPEVFLAAVVTERRRRRTEKLAGSQRVPTVAELPSGWR